MSYKKFCNMTPAEKFDDLKSRVADFNLMDLPGQPQGIHMGTSYLIDDLWRELQRTREPIHEPVEDECG